MVGVPKTYAKRNPELPENFYRPTSGRSPNWYVRLVPPSGLQGEPSVREFRKSTGTADLRRAKSVGAALIAAKRAEWDAILARKKAAPPGPTPLSEELIKHICAMRAYRWLRMDDEARFEGSGYDDAGRAGLNRLCQTADAAMRSVLSRGKASANWGSTLDVVDTWCGQLDLAVNRTDPLYPELVRQFAGVELATVAKLLQRNSGEAAPTPAKPADVEAHLNDMVAPYREYKQQAAGAKHVGTSVNVWLRLIEHLGDVPLSSVRATDLYDFLSARMNAPAKPWSMKYAHGLVKSTLKEVFSLARTQGRLTGPNPVDDLHVLPKLSAEAERGRRNPRFPYTDKQLTTVFSSEWYDPAAVRWTGKMRDDLGARYWVPLICTFHGSRVREVLQLVAADVALQDHVPVIHFRAELEGVDPALLLSGAKRSLKTEDSERLVPIHPKLLELGFLDFVAERHGEGNPNVMLFPSSLPKPGGRSPILGRAYEQAFLRYVRDTLEFGNGYGNHSFRHQLEDRIRAAQLPGQMWPPGLALAFTGRKRARSEDGAGLPTEGSAAGYGRGYTARSMLHYIRQLDFTKVKLPPSFQKWRRLTSAQSQTMGTPARRRHRG